jgi:predicted nucleic acid-binding protein
MLLDTSFLVDLLDRDPAALARARSLERDGIATRIPTPALFELWRGVHLAARTSEEADRVVGLLAAYASAPLDGPAAAAAGEIDARLIKAGTPIDPEDSMIAGIALAMGDALLTRNVRHFSRIPRVRVEEY